MLQDFVLNYTGSAILQISSLFPYIPVNSHGKFSVLKIPRIVQP